MRKYFPIFLPRVTITDSIWIFMVTFNAHCSYSRIPAAFAVFKYLQLKYCKFASPWTVLDWCAIQKDEEFWILDHQPEVLEDIRRNYVTVLRVRCLKWQVVCSLNRTQGCVASSMFKVVGSLQSKQSAGMSEQQQGYLFRTNAVIPHKTSQQAHARLVPSRNNSL